MPNENEVLAVFRADVEQFKKDVGSAAVATGELGDKVAQTGETTQKFEKQTKGAHGAVKTLSQGLGGVAGLLGITGRLFGVNTDKLEGFIFASKEFIKVGRDISHAQKLATAATQAGTAATIEATAAEKLLSTARSLSLPVIGLAIAAGVALVAGISFLVSSLKGESKAMEETKGKVDAYGDAHKDAIKSVAELDLEIAVLNGTITQNQADQQKIVAEFQQARIALREKHTKELKALNFRDFKNEKEFQDAVLLLQDAQAQEEEDLQNVKSKRLKALRLTAANERKDDVKKETKAIIKEEALGLTELQKMIIKFIEDLPKELAKNRKEVSDEQQQILDDDAKRFEEHAKEFFKQDQDRQDQVKDNIDKRNKDRIEAEKMVLDTLFKAQQEAFDKRQELLKAEQDSQEKNIDLQRDLAARGLDNTLAFEQRRAAELQRQQQKEAEAQKRVKLLETFLNSLAEFSKTDPKTALSKALLQVALAQAASAVFAEDGGIIGEIGARSNLSRRHRGGGDVLLHAQTGEGILSRSEMDNLGKRNFHLLKDAARFPIRDDVFGMPKIAMMGGSQVSNAEVVKELKALQHIVKNKKEMHYDLRQNGEYMITQVENGVTDLIKGKLRKPRFRA